MNNRIMGNAFKTCHKVGNPAVTHTRLYNLHWVLILIFTLFYSCEKPERDNPWDDGADPASWAPHDLTYSVDPSGSITITWRWDYDVAKPEGFKIDRQVDNQSWENEIQVFDSNQKIFTDNNLNLVDHLYQYRVYAYAGKNVSEKIETDKLNILRSLNIGDSYGGGIIVYFFLPGDPGYVERELHGLIASPSDQSTGATWGCFGATIGGTSTALSTGQSNTQAIVNGCSTAGIAARICNDLVLNGFNDWYLPSKDELNKLFVNRYTIGGFANDGYWSSSEYSSGSAWLKNFYDGLQGNANKYNNLRVRAVRAF